MSIEITSIDKTNMKYFTPFMYKKVLPEEGIVGLIIDDEAAGVGVFYVEGTTWDIKTRHVYNVVGEGEKVDGERSIKLRDPFGQTIDVPFSVYNTCFGDAYIMDAKDVKDDEKELVDINGDKITENNIFNIYPAEED